MVCDPTQTSLTTMLGKARGWVPGAGATCLAGEGSFGRTPQVGESLGPPEFLLSLKVEEDMALATPNVHAAYSTQMSLVVRAARSQT